MYRSFYSLDWVTESISLKYLLLYFEEIIFKKMRTVFGSIKMSNFIEHNIVYSLPLKVTKYKILFLLPYFPSGESETRDGVLIFTPITTHLKDSVL